MKGCLIFSYLRDKFKNISTYQNSSLCHCMFNLIPSNNFGFLQNLKCIKLAGISLLYKHDLSIWSLTDDWDHLKVFLCDITACSPLLFGDNLLVLHFKLLILLRLLLLGVVLRLLLLHHLLLLHEEGLLLVRCQILCLGLLTVNFHLFKIKLIN